MIPLKSWVSWLVGSPSTVSERVVSPRSSIIRSIIFLLTRCSASLTLRLYVLSCRLSNTNTLYMTTPTSVIYLCSTHPPPGGREGLSTTHRRPGEWGDRGIHHHQLPPPGGRVVVATLPIYIRPGGPPLQKIIYNNNYNIRHEVGPMATTSIGTQGQHGSPMWQTDRQVHRGIAKGA